MCPRAVTGAAPPPPAQLGEAPATRRAPGAAAARGGGGGAAARGCTGARRRRTGAACRCGTTPSRSSADVRPRYTQGGPGHYIYRRDRQRVEPSFSLFYFIGDLSFFSSTG